MTSFASKMREVESSPYMLAIFKDNQHRHLFYHAMECWKMRHGQAAASNVNNWRVLDTNPILYCTHPPLEAVQQYFSGKVSYQLLSSRILKCPIVARYAFEENLESMAEMHKMEMLQFENSYILRVIDLIEFDEELTYKVIVAGLTKAMPEPFQRDMTPEQKATAAICA